jgi:protocatechuate 3,4-dioxygenase alpha subunit
MTQAELIPTSSQTVGPFVEIGCTYLATDRLSENTDITVRGRVIDGDGVAVPDYMLEIWQPNEGAAAFARVMPSLDGSFRFRASLGSIGPDAAAPHLVILVFMRGLLKPVLTRMYFPDHAHNASDPVLSLVPAHRRSTLVAIPALNAPSGEHALEWNLVLQGAGETVFFEW